MSLVGVFPTDGLGIVSVDEKGIIKLWSEDLKELKSKLFVNCLQVTSFAQLENTLLFGSKHGCFIYWGWITYE